MGPQDHIVGSESPQASALVRPLPHIIFRFQLLEAGIDKTDRNRTQFMGILRIEVKIEYALLVAEYRSLSE